MDSVPLSPNPCWSAINCSSSIASANVRPESDAEKAIDDWTRDGRYVIFGKLAAGRKREEWALPLFGDRKPFPVIAGTGTIQGPQVSPNGKWIAYTSDESGAHRKLDDEKCRKRDDDAG